MLNTPTDYHTFDQVVVKKKSHKNVYKWSCLVVTLLICALMVVLWYWDEMMGTPEKFVQIDRTVRLNSNVSIGDGDKAEEVVNQILETIGAASDKSGTIVSTLVDEAEEIADQIKEGIDSIGAEGAEIIESAGAQVEQLVDAAKDEIARLATEIGDELEDLAATTIDKVRDAGGDAVVNAINAASPQ